MNDEQKKKLRLALAGEGRWAAEQMVYMWVRKGELSFPLGGTLVWKIKKGYAI
jgi:hypothetical protein